MDGPLNFALFPGLGLDASRIVAQSMNALFDSQGSNWNGEPIRCHVPPALSNVDRSPYGPDDVCLAIGDRVYAVFDVVVNVGVTTACAPHASVCDKPVPKFHVANVGRTNVGPSVGHLREYASDLFIRTHGSFGHRKGRVSIEVDRLFCVLRGSLGE